MRSRSTDIRTPTERDTIHDSTSGQTASDEVTASCKRIHARAVRVVRTAWWCESPRQLTQQTLVAIGLFSVPAPPHTYSSAFLLSSPLLGHTSVSVSNAVSAISRPGLRGTETDTDVCLGRLQRRICMREINVWKRSGQLSELTRKLEKRRVTLDEW